MKKSIALLLTLLLALNLVACGSDSGTTTTETTPPATTTESGTETAVETPVLESSGEPVVLKFWESAVEGAEFTQMIAAEFTEMYPHITFEFEPVSHTDATQQILLDGPAGIGPDFFMIPHDMLGANVSSGVVLPAVNPSHITDNFVPAAVTAATLGGVVYGYPMSIETYALFYNKDLLPEPPKTFEEVLAFAAEYNNPAENRYALVWEPNNAYFSYIFFSGYGSQLFGPNGDDPMQHNINAPNTIKGIEFFQSLRSILDVPSADLSGDFCNQAFESGLAAMYLVGPWRIADCIASGVNFGITTIPSFPGESSPPASFSGVRIFCISAYSEHPVEAAMFLEYLTSREVQLRRFEANGQIPARKDAQVDDELSAGILAQSAFAFPMPSINEMGQYWQSMGAAYGNIWDGADVVSELNAAAEVMEANIGQ
ncbi:MAG: maltose ABC transporter substrate-binding protein [Lachnospiraceae bacterium]|nr:maltose ABC transporter substrate-binding protein [Lachnospiraceae bacterium]